MAGIVSAPPAKCGNRRRGSFIFPLHNNTDIPGAEPTADCPYSSAGSAPRGLRQFADGPPASEISTPVPAEVGTMHRTRVPGRMIVIAFKIEGIQRYSWIKNKRSAFVSWTRPLIFSRSKVN
jgi:hypothetical protein